MTIPPPPAPPPAFRLKRPYASEDEFVAGDGHALGKGGMILVGAGPRPSGLIVRFEIALRDGTALFRGEGKVVGHRMLSSDGLPPGLEIRFTRLDARGKSIVDRALRAREAALSPSPPPMIPDLTPPPERVAPVPLAAASPLVPVELISDEHAEPAAEPPTVPRISAAPPAPPPSASVEQSVAPTADRASPARALGDRDVLLARLRDGRSGVSAPDAGARASLLARLRTRTPS